MPKSVSVRSGQVEFLKLNLEKREWRDAYQWLLALSWPQFAALIAGVYIVINLIFAEFYALGGESIAGITGSIPTTEAINSARLAASDSTVSP